MRNGEEDSQIRTVFCGNLSEEVTDSILYELFYQAGPVEAIRRPKDQNGRPKSFGFVVYKHECSVPYAVELFKGTKLFNRIINVNSRDNHLPHIPVLDTHLTEFTGPQERNESRRSHDWEKDRRSCRDHRSEHSSRRHNPKDDRNKNKVSSWSELKNDPEKANKFISKYSDQDDSQSSFGNAMHSRDTLAYPAMPDFNALLQLGQQMVIPGVMGLPGMSGVNNMGFGPILGNDTFPSMQGRMGGGNRLSPSREGVRDYYEDRERRDYHDVQANRREHHERREDRRNHPYDRHPNHWEDHRRHDRGYSSSRSTHDRERRDRRSR